MRGNLRVFCVQHPSLFFDYWEKKKSPQDLVQSRWLLFFFNFAFAKHETFWEKVTAFKKKGDVWDPSVGWDVWVTPQPLQHPHLLKVLPLRGFLTKGL